MQHAEKVVEQVQAATRDVFATMLDLSLETGEPRLTERDPEPADGVVSFIGFAGEWVGTGSISCGTAIACKIADRLLMCDHSAVDDEVLDAVAEVTNMIIGNLKTALEEEFGSMSLSIPTVIYGRNFTTKTMGRNEWTLVPFTAEGEKFEVQVCLMPNPEGKRVGRATIHLPHSVNA